MPQSRGLRFRDWKTHCVVFGDGEVPGRLPLLCLHGGPGGTHLPLEGLGQLSEQGRRVVYYDQLGSGDSDRPDDPSLWTVETYVEQLRSVRDGLGLDEVHLFGTSWGGMLALEYAFTEPPGLKSLILNSTPTSAPRWAEEGHRLFRPGLMRSRPRRSSSGAISAVSTPSRRSSRAPARSSAPRSTRRCGGRTSSRPPARSRTGT